MASALYPRGPEPRKERERAVGIRRQKQRLERELKLRRVLVHAECERRQPADRRCGYAAARAQQRRTSATRLRNNAAAHEADNAGAATQQGGDMKSQQPA